MNMKSAKLVATLAATSPVHAEWSATSSGDSVEGMGDMTMNMAGQTMSMTMTWTGERIGQCP
jgi:hypothetical protein